MLKSTINLPMKKIFLCLLSLFPVYYVCAGTQIKLEHTFSGIADWQGENYAEHDLFPAGCYYVTETTGTTYTVKIFNPDYSVHTDTTYQFVPPAGYIIARVSMSRRIFNADTNLEFLVTFRETDINFGDTHENTLLFDENGTVLKDFGYANMIFTNPQLHLHNGNLRLRVVKRYFVNNEFESKTEIYSVPGTPAADYALKSADARSAYPNPAATSIVLPYKLQQGEKTLMSILNLNGQLIEFKQIDYLFDKILLDVSGYNKGPYLYKVNGESKIFIVN
jgi:hypothetical protein